MSIATAFSLLAILLLLSAAMLLSIGHAALAAASPARLLRLEKQGQRHARTAIGLRESGDALSGALHLGVLLTVLVAGMLAAGLAMQTYGVMGLAYAIVPLALLVAIGCSVLPQALAARAPESIAVALAQPLASALRILAPLQGAASALASRWSERHDADAVRRAHTAAHAGVTSADRTARTTDHDRYLLDNVLDLGDLTVADVMVHRTEMVTVDADEPPEAIVEAVMRTEYSRVPLWRTSPENIVGILHAKDLLRVIHGAGGDLSTIDIGKLVRPPWFVPDIRPLSEQLKAFRRRKTHFALVVDEYGEVEGLVTLEDILEEIVGDISDEHDVAVPGVQPQPDGSVTVDGTVPIRDLNRTMDWDLPDDQATTVAGLVIHEARSIPEAGQAFTFHGFRFRVLRKERNRIASLRITTVTPILALPPPSPRADDVGR